MIKIMIKKLADKMGLTKRSRLVHRVEAELDYLSAIGFELNPTNISDGIAQYFEAQNIGGMRGSSNYCPVANYLKPVAQIRVGHVWLTVVGPPFDANRHRYDRYDIILPLSVSRFVKEFDDGKYPKLGADEIPQTK